MILKIVYFGNGKDVIGGPMLHNINGFVIKSHGRATPEAFAQALKNCLEFVKKDINKLIIEELKLVNLSQAERDDVMVRFKKRQLQILVATDVAARGLDVEDLTHVINYNMPDDDEIYIHRSGRTGRAGKKGVAMVIIHGREIRKLKDIEKMSGISFTKKDVPNGLDICKKRLYALVDKIEKVNVNEEQIEPFLPYILEKLNWLDREKLIKHFVSTEFNRYLSYNKNSKDINVETYEKENTKRKKSNQRKFYYSKKSNRRNKRNKRKRTK